MASTLRQGFKIFKTVKRRKFNFNYGFTVSSCPFCSSTSLLSYDVGGVSKLSIPQRLVESTPVKVQPYLRLMRADKPIGTWLLYWPCTWSIALAAPPGCLPDFYLLALFGAGSLFMRGAGCTINDLLDQDYDRKVDRTKMRPIPSGQISNLQALTFLSGLLGVSLTILLQLNWYSVLVGASSMALVVSYPLAKRYTYWPQVFLGLTLNWGVLIAWTHFTQELASWLLVLPLYTACVCYTVIYDTIYSHQLYDTAKHRFYPIFLLRALRFEGNGCILLALGLTFNWGCILGWSAVHGTLYLPAVLSLYGGSICWTLVYDTIYAHQDKTDDLIAGVKSTALLFGDKTSLYLSGFGVAMISGLITSGVAMEQTWPFYVGIAGAAAQLSWQIFSVDINNPSHCWRIFSSNRYLGLLIFLSVVAGNLLRRPKLSDEDNSHSTDQISI